MKGAGPGRGGVGGVIVELPGLKLKSHVINIYFFGSGKNGVGGRGWVSIYKYKLRKQKPSFF